MPELDAKRAKQDESHEGAARARTQVPRLNASRASILTRHRSEELQLPPELADVPEGALSAASIRRDATYRRLLAMGDLMAAAFAFLVSISILGNHDFPGPWLIVATVAIVPVCKLAGLYDRDQHLIHKTTLDEAPTIFAVSTLYTLLVFLGGENSINGHFGQGQAAALWALLFLSLLAARSVARKIAGAMVQEERCVILGNAEAAHWLTGKLARSPAARTVVVGRVPLNHADSSVNGLPVLGTPETLSETLKEHRIDRALMAPGRLDDDIRLLDAIRVTKRLGVRISVLPRLFEVVGSAYEFDDVEGAALLGVRRHGLTRSSRMIKRCFDLAGSLIGLLLLAPLLGVIALAVKLDSRGPVFFRQRRMGRDDEVFEIFKFRTMIDGADAQKSALGDRNEAGGGLFKMKDDPRITRVGKFLRRTSLDELPQLINVVKGDMSLVGPRPLVLDEDSLIDGLHRHRMLLPPGVTGLWQIFGSARVPLNEMVKIDYLYGANWSLWLDIKVLLRTVPFVLGRRGL
jgi:exopolysaccharide biosynthesis polyprenyl glycosylphosphotransferase